MALLNLTGFETGDAAEITLTGAGATISTTQKRTGSYALRANAAAATAYGMINKYGADGKATDFTETTYYASFYVYFVAFPGSSVEFANFGTSPSVFTAGVIGFQVTNAGAIDVIASSGGGQVAGGLSTATWYRVDAKVVKNGACTAEVFKAGASLGSKSCTGFNINPSRAYFGSVASATIDMYIDDIAIDDAAFTGEHEIRVAVPTGNSATNTAWTASAGNKWACIDEIPPSATDYIDSGTGVGNQRYSATHDTAATLGAKGDVLGVKTVGVFWEPTSTTTLGAIGIRSGSTNFEQTAVDIGTTAEITLARVDGLDPNTSAAWTAANFNSAEPEVLRSTSDTSAIRVKWLGLMVMTRGAISATSALVLPFPVMTGSGTHTDIQGTSALKLPFPYTTASGLQKQIGTSALKLPFPYTTAVGKQKQMATSALKMPFPYITASGQQTGSGASGTSALKLPFPYTTAVGLQRILATAALKLPFPYTTSVGNMRPKGVATLTLPFPYMTASGRKTYRATATLVLPFPVMAGVGLHTDIQGVGVLVIPFPVLAGAGKVKAIGIAILTLPFPTMAGVGHVPVKGAGALTLPFPIVTASGLALLYPLQHKPQVGAGAFYRPRPGSGAFPRPGVGTGRMRPGRP